jgi:hypothetical protein
MDSSKTKKMVLVPHELLSNLRASQMRSNRHEEGVVERLEDLDTEMSSVLNSKDPVDVKFKLYQQALQRYLNLKDELRKPVYLQIDAEPTAAGVDAVKKNNVTAGADVPPVTVASSETQTRLPLDTLLDRIPHSYRNQAHKLVRHLEKTDAVDWNAAGELVVGGQRVLDSDIREIVKELSRKRTKVAAAPPIGIDVFVGELMKTNVPPDAILNQRLWKNYATAAAVVAPLRALVRSTTSTPSTPHVAATPRGASVGSTPATAQSASSSGSAASGATGRKRTQLNVSVVNGIPRVLHFDEDQATTSQAPHKGSGLVHRWKPYYM